MTIEHKYQLDVMDFDAGSENLTRGEDVLIFLSDVSNSTTYKALSFNMSRVDFVDYIDNHDLLGVGYAVKRLEGGTLVVWKKK